MLNFVSVRTIKDHHHHVDIAARGARISSWITSWYLIVGNPLGGHLSDWRGGNIN
jgi:hypothetical protein